MSNQDTFFDVTRPVMAFLPDLTLTWSDDFSIVAEFASIMEDMLQIIALP